MESNPKKATTSSKSINMLIDSLREGTFGEILEDWKWILGYSARYKGAIAFYVLLGIFSTTFGLASSVASKYLIDIITGRKTEQLGLLIVIMVGTSAFSLAFESIISRISTRISLDINKDIQADIFDQIMDADWLSVSQYSHGDILNRFNGDVSAISSNAVNWLPKILISLYQFAATFLVIFHYDPLMAFIALASAPFMLLISRIVIRKQREYGKQVREISSGMMTYEVENFYNYDTIKSFGVMRHAGDVLRGWQNKYKDKSLEYNLFSIQTNIFMSVIGMLVQFIAFGYCLFLLWSDRITYGTMTLFLTQRSRLSTAFNNVVGIIPGFLSGSISAHRIRELTDLPRDVHLTESSELEPFRESGFEVRMEDLSFSYSKEKPVIRNSDFHAGPGEIVALVGPSGEGKTTMIRLILGLIRPEQGSAYIKPSGTDIEVEMNADTRGLFAYVPQGNTIMSGTIAENLRMVKEDASDEEIIAALKTACAWEFVEKLPDGIESIVRERGRGLSEGQAQRLAIARAILRNSPILLMDEATSALDVATERRVLRRVMQGNPGRTCIVTTHRPSVLSMCSRVYRVIEGEVRQLTEEEAAKMAMDF